MNARSPRCSRIPRVGSGGRGMRRSMRNRAHALTVLALVLILTWVWPAEAGADDVFDRVSHGFADSAGVKIHYASLGRGPLVVMIHGFPDFWYTWRHQMAALSTDFQVVAVDLRGYNLSDKPAGVENYDMSLLEADIAAVTRH